jgi:Bacterial DNA-binding protein
MQDDFILNQIYAKINVAIYEKHKVSLTKEQVKEIIDAQFKGVKAAMKELRTVELSGLGRFYIPDKNRIFFDEYLKQLQAGQNKAEAIEVSKKRLSMVVNKIMNLKFAVKTNTDGVEKTETSEGEKSSPTV